MLAKEVNESFFGELLKLYPAISRQEIECSPCVVVDLNMFAVHGSLLTLPLGEAPQNRPKLHVGLSARRGALRSFDAVCRSLIAALREFYPTRRDEDKQPAP